MWLHYFSELSFSEHPTWNALYNLIVLMCCRHSTHSLSSRNIYTKRLWNYIRHHSSVFSSVVQLHSVYNVLLWVVGGLSCLLVDNFNSLSYSQHLSIVIIVVVTFQTFQTYLYQFYPHAQCVCVCLILTVNYCLPQQGLIPMGVLRTWLSDFSAAAL